MSCCWSSLFMTSLESISSSSAVWRECFFFLCRHGHNQRLQLKNVKRNEMLLICFVILLILRGMRYRDFPSFRLIRLEGRFWFDDIWLLYSTVMSYLFMLNCSIRSISYGAWATSAYPSNKRDENVMLLPWSFLLSFNSIFPSGEKKWSWQIWLDIMCLFFCWH